MALRAAQGLCIAATVLLLIYGADAAGNFLGMDDRARGVGFGASSVAMLTIAYFISRKERSTVVTSLLLFCGAIIIAGMVAVAASGSGNMGAIGMTIGLGAWILALGVVKSVRARAMRTV